MPAAEPYQVHLIVTMEPEHFDDPDKRQRAQKALDTLESKLTTCSGIEVADAILESEANVSLADFRLMERFDFDYLSAEID